jgi:hypothetical protein
MDQVTEKTPVILLRSTILITSRNDDFSAMGDHDGWGTQNWVGKGIIQCMK